MQQSTLHAQDINAYASTEHIPSSSTESNESLELGDLEATDSLGDRRVTTNNTKSLIEALYAAGSQGSIITSITAQACGIAFLDNGSETMPNLMQSLRNVQDIELCTDLCIHETFGRIHGQLVLLPLPRRRLALRDAIRDGRLGEFLTLAPSLKRLNIDLQCHELTNPEVERSNLDSMLGRCVWPHLQHLQLRGIWTSECQLNDFISRHRGSLRFLALSDIILKSGSWSSFFAVMKGLLSSTQLQPRTFCLSGSLHFREAGQLHGIRWDLSARSCQGQSLGEILVQSVFNGRQQSILEELEHFAQLTV